MDKILIKYLGGNMRDNIIKNIIDMELNFFVNVNASEGTGSCQNDLDTFKIMRNSQIQTWSEELLESYQNDLEKAMNEGRNLMTEKYARMMNYTHPEEFNKIKDNFSEIPKHIENKIESIITVYLEWDKETFKKYPLLKERGRKTNSSEDTSQSTSFETYFRGELQTYSEKTIDIYEAYVQEMKKEKSNLVEKQLYNTAVSYGYNSLEELNEKLSKNINKL